MDINDVIQFANDKYAVLVQPSLIDDNPFSPSNEERRRKAVIEARKKLKEILENIIIKKGKLTDSEQLTHFIRIGNNIIKDYHVEDGRLIESIKFNEQALAEGVLSGYPSWLIDIISTFIDHLSQPENNLRRIKKCLLCGDFFIAKRMRKDQKYCSVCSRKNKMTPEEFAKYMKAYRANPARKKMIKKKKREERIQRMIKGGYTKKQAETILDSEA